MPLLDFSSSIEPGPFPLPCVGMLPEAEDTNSCPRNSVGRHPAAAQVGTTSCPQSRGHGTPAFRSANIRRSNTLGHHADGGQPFQALRAANSRVVWNTPWPCACRQCGLLEGENAPSRWCPALPAHHFPHLDHFSRAPPSKRTDLDVRWIAEVICRRITTGQVSKPSMPTMISTGPGRPRRVR